MAQLPLALVQPTDGVSGAQAWDSAASLSSVVHLGMVKSSLSLTSEAPPTHPGSLCHFHAQLLPLRLRCILRPREVTLALPVSMLRGRWGFRARPVPEVKEWAIQLSPSLT